MNIPFFIALRYQRSKQKNPLVALIATFSSIGIALGVAVLIVGLSAMNGFERELNQRILAVVPHVEIVANSNDKPIIKQWQNLAQRLETNEKVTALSPFVSFTALIENGSKLKVVQIKGINKTSAERVSALNKFVENEGWQRFGQQGGLILGAGIAAELGVHVGDWVSLLVSRQSDSQRLSQPSRERVRVTAILRLDGQLDHSYALLPLSEAQALLGYQSDEITGIELKVQEPFLVQSIDYSALRDYPQSLYVMNWTAKFGYMYRDIQLIRTIMYIAMALVISVACFNIISTLIMAVKDKQGDIAIMRTLGADNAFIKRIFIWYGLLAGMKGCFIGIILGVIFALNLTPIMQGIESLLGKKLLSDGIYFIDFLPSELHWLDIFGVWLTTLILSLCASLYPAERAAKLHPARILSNY